MKIKAFFSVLLIQMVIASWVSASPVYVFPLWDTPESESLTNEMQFTDGDLTLTITAWTSSYNGRNRQRLPWQQVVGDNVGVFRDKDGLGVISSETDGNDLDGGRTRNAATDPDEGLLFVFSRFVSLLDVFVGDLGSNDDVNISVVNAISPSNLNLGPTLSDLSGPDDTREFPFEVGSRFKGSAFLVWVDGRSDEVEILGIAAAAVPAPTMTIAMLLLSGLWLRVRRNKYKA